MADIFVSYARADRQRVAPLVAALEAKGFSVWWDPEIVGGQEFDALITRELEAAKAAIVVWTPASVASRWVRGEARFAADQGLLTPVQFDAPSLPLDFRAIHTIDFDAWNDDAGSRPFQDLLRALKDRRPGPSETPSRAAAPEPPAASVCVLPFVNMSGDPEQEYFSDGLSEELLNQLAQMKGLKVAARTSCFAFKGQNPDLKLVSEKLGVAHVLEGSVRKAGARLRITAQLIKAADGFHLWSNTFNRELDDIFQIQEDIARAVAEALKITLGMDGGLAAPGGTTNVEAYDLYLRAQAVAREAGADASQRAIALYREAVALDPGFAMAWLGLALACANAMIVAPGVEDWRRLGDEAFERAIASAPDAPMIHALRGGQLFLGRQDWIGAGRAFERAIELEPSGVIAGVTDNSNVGFPFFLASVGRMTEAVESYRMAVRADPLATHQMFQFALDCAGRHDEADADHERTAGLEIDTAITEYFSLLRCMARDEATAVEQQLRRQRPLVEAFLPVFGEVLNSFNNRPAAVALLMRAFGEPFYQNPAQLNGIASMAAFLGDDELALAALRKAFVEMRGVQVAGIWHPLFARARKTKAFKSIVRDLGFADYWRQSGHWGDFARPVGEEDFEIVR
jgi:adenylate cyclase